jgi:hypothetical protein
MISPLLDQTVPRHGPRIDSVLPQPDSASCASLRFRRRISLHKRPFAHFSPSAGRSVESAILKASICFTVKLYAPVTARRYHSHCEKISFSQTAIAFSFSLEAMVSSFPRTGRSSRFRRKSSSRNWRTTQGICN